MKTGLPAYALPLLAILFVGFFQARAQELSYVPYAYTWKEQGQSRVCRLGVADYTMRYGVWTLGMPEVRVETPALPPLSLRVSRHHYTPGMTSGYANAFQFCFDWINTQALTPYFGFTAGVAENSAGGEVHAPGMLMPMGNASNHAGLHYQFMTGAIWEISPTWEMEFAYHHAATETDTTRTSKKANSLGERLEDFTLRSNEVRLGVTFRF